MREGGLRCDFPPLETHRPEERNRELKLVDFVWLPSDATWLVEIKNPYDAPEDQQSGAVRGTLETLRNGRLVDQHLLPKLFGTYAWLFRAGLLRGLPHRYVALIATDPLDAGLRLAAVEAIQRTIDAVGPLDRTSGISPVAEVHDLASWNALAGTPEITREG